VTADVVPAGAERLEDYVDLFARTFADDEIVTWPFPAGDVDERVRAQFVPLGRGFAEAHWLWEVRPAAGFAGWVPPEGAERLLEITEGSLEGLRPLTDDDGARFVMLWDWIEEHLPEEPHWFLDHIAVSPEHQGEGIGKALIRFGLDRAERDGTCAFLETSREGNVGLYEHLGFRVVHAADAPGGGPFLWFMRWDPA
jgi:ribosomal protein S18 acetylase RimI-like enzyme